MRKQRLLTRDKKKTQEKAIQLYKSGLSISEVSLETNTATSTIYKWLKDNNVESKRKQQSSKYDVYLNQVKDMIEKRYSQRDMAKELGVDRNVIRFLLKKHNLKTDPKDSFKTEEEVSKSIKEYNPDFEYVSGYSGWQSKITIKCTACGSVFKKGYVQFKIKKAVCEHCVLISRKVGKSCEIVKEAIKKSKKKQVINDKKIKKELICKIAKQLARLHNCPNCDKRTIGKVYCSDRCQRRMRHRKKDIKRRMRRKNIIDKDITLEKVCKRDNGICYLCNKPIDWNDFKYDINGNFHQGNQYPNVEHVIPRAKGGEHSWKNVKLAHSLCNSYKRDLII